MVNGPRTKRTINYFLYNRSICDSCCSITCDKLGEIMKREDVYKLIDGERDYQDKMGSDRTDGSDKAVGDYLTLLRSLCYKADMAYYDNAGNNSALDNIRKLAAVAVRCMERYDTPARQVPLKSED